MAYKRILRDVFRSKSQKKILIVSLQKCGTHLIHKIMSEAGMESVGVGKDCTVADFRKLKDHQYLWSHYPPSDNFLSEIENGNRNFKLIFNYRDPRDALVSWLYWMHPENAKVTHTPREYVKKTYRGFTDDELLEIFIKIDKFRPIEYNIIENFRLSRAMLFHPGVHKIRFEDLVGAKGGGNDGDQFVTLEKLFSYLQISNIGIKHIAAKAFDRESETFRRGCIGEYKEKFSKKNLTLFEKLHCDLIAQYGYKIE